MAFLYRVTLTTERIVPLSALAPTRDEDDPEQVYFELADSRRGPYEDTVIRYLWDVWRDKRPLVFAVDATAILALIRLDEAPDFVSEMLNDSLVRRYTSVKTVEDFSALYLYHYQEEAPPERCDSSCDCPWQRRLRLLFEQHIAPVFRPLAAAPKPAPEPSPAEPAPVTWTDQERRRLEFARYLVQAGRLSR